ncbi:MAG: energy transducer TonB [Thermoanaerobaculia bacterium]
MFEHSLIGLEARKKSRRGWFSLPMAIAIHLLALATFTFASVWDVAAVPEPQTNDIFYVSLPPPPPPPALGGGRQETRTPVRQEEVKPPTPQQTVQPPNVLTDLPPVVAQTVTTEEGIPGLPPGPGRPDGTVGGDENGDPDSEVIGSLTNVPPPPVVQVTDNEPIVVGGAVKKPEILVKTQPRYTELARRANVEGVVILKAVIDERGYVTDLEVLKDLPMGLDKAAIDAVRTWRFKPATLHDRPVKVYFNLTVNFQIQR